MTAPPIDTSKLLYNPARDDPPSLPPPPPAPAAPAPQPACTADRAHHFSIVVAHACGETEASEPLVWDAGANFRSPIATDHQPFEAIITAGGG